MIKRLGLIAGGGQLPLMLSAEAKGKGVYVVAVALEGEAGPGLEKCVDKIYWAGPGELKRLIGIFKEEKIKKAVMVGSVTKARLFRDTPKLDNSARRLLRTVRNKNDMVLLKSAARVLKFFGITLLDSTLFLNGYLPRKGVFSKRHPTKEEWEDIKFGFSLAKKVSTLDVGQTVVVKHKVILAVEALEGTDEAIKRGGELGNGDVVIIKTARRRQDKRFDIPTVGPETLRSLKNAGGRVLAIEAKNTILIDRKECVALADANDFSLVAV